MSIQLLTGDCRELLKTLSDESVHCVVTSPPYFGLRDYGTAQWEGGDPSCTHTYDRTLGMRASTLGGGKASQPNGSVYANCPNGCGARRIDSQIGLEQTPQEYVEQLVSVFREVRRVLRKDGTVWLNLGDSYANNGVKDPSSVGGFTGDRIRAKLAGNNPNDSCQDSRPRKVPDGLKSKDLIGIPWRVAFALQADGWWLRQDIIWAKPNPMPESVTDRCTKAHEYIFLLTKSARYFYDAEAIAEPVTREFWNETVGPKYMTAKDGRMDGGKREGNGPMNGTRNKRSVWTVATQPFSEAHFATFPPDLIEPCIKAGTSEKGCCAKCGALWVRQTEVQRVKHPNTPGKGGRQIVPGSETSESSCFRTGLVPITTTVGWSPSCQCHAATTPCTVLDPFAGAGTTGLVADRLGRNAIMIELNPQYADLAKTRIIDDAPLFAEWKTENAAAEK